MHRRRRFGLLAGLALVVGVLVAGCSQLPFGQPNGPSLGIFSRAQISFSSLSFTSISNTQYTQLVPSASAVAKGLGNDTWTSTLGSADGSLVLQCTNNGSNVPNGVVNYPILTTLALQTLLPTDTLRKNGTEPIDLQSGDLATWQAWVAENLDPALVCPNANYSVQLLGFLWPSITINLYSGTDTTGTPADSVTFVCTDPANPSADTCTILNGKKNS